MAVLRFAVEVFSVGGRLRARLVQEHGGVRFRLGEWWLTSRDGRRYKPLKPAPPTARAVLERLPTPALEKLVLALLAASPGDRVEIEVSEDFTSASVRLRRGGEAAGAPAG